MFAVAQAISIPGDVVENVARHVRLAALAATHGARLVVFPELSLTSYDLRLTTGDAIAIDDGRLATLDTLAARHGLIVVAGAPLAAAEGLQIAALVFRPDGRRSSHTKQYLHPGEEVAFRAGPGGPPVRVDDHLVGLAICADIVHPAHASAAAAVGATVYAAGVLISENGYAPDTALLHRYAAEHQMLVLMANYGAPTGGWVSAGRSAVWVPGGRLLAEAPAHGEAVVVARHTGVEWEGRVVMGYEPAR